MAGSPQISAEPIRLHFSDQTRVVVTPDDEDRFMTTAEEAARACRQVQDLLVWQREFDGFLAHVFAWCTARRGTIANTYLAFSTEGLELFVLTKGSEYRFDLDDVISELDIDLARRFPRCPTEITQLPEAPVGSLQAFFAPGKSLEIYGG